MNIKQFLSSSLAIYFIIKEINTTLFINDICNVSSLYDSCIENKSLEN